jgi:hypothetical protein
VLHLLLNPLQGSAAGTSARASERARIAGARPPLRNLARPGNVQRVQFLWQLLPGAREARNQVLVGYAWILAAGLWLGVPDVSPESSLKELTDAVGPVGIGIALSFGAFLLGSLSEDFVSSFYRVRGARAFSLETEAPAFVTIRSMEDSVRAELERLEGAIDRVSAEVLLRVGLIPPVLVAAAAGARDDWYWPVTGFSVSVALVWQARHRLAALRPNLAASREIRAGVEESVLPQIEALEAERAEREKAEEKRRLEEEQRRQQQSEEEDRQREEADRKGREADEARRAELARLEELERREELSEADAERLKSLREFERRVAERVEEIKRRRAEQREQVEARTAELEEERRRLAEPQQGRLSRFVPQRRRRRKPH